MARVTAQQLPAHVKVRADLVENYGFSWEYIPAYPTPSTDKRIQIRNEAHYTPATQVSKYAAALRNKAKFPPPVFTRDGYLVDGNTTTHAYRKLEQLRMEALVLDVDWDKAGENTQQAVRLLGAAANIANGRGLDKQEVIDAILYVVNRDGDHYDGTRIAALLGVTTSTVHNILAEKRAKEQAASLDLELNGSLTASHLRALGYALDKLTPTPWAALVRLVQDSGMKYKEISEFAKNMKAAGDQEAQLGFLHQSRERMTDRIRQYKRTGKSLPSPAAQLRQCAGATFLKFATTPDRLVEYGPDCAEHLTTLEAIASVVAEVITEQRRVNQQAVFTFPAGE